MAAHGRHAAWDPARDAGWDPGSSGDGAAAWVGGQASRVGRPTGGTGRRDPAGDRQRSGRHRPHRARWAISGATALVVALAAAGVLIGLPPTEPPPAPGPLTLRTAWPKATIGSIPASAPDGPAFDPLYMLDSTTTVGTAATPDGTRLRLLLWAGTGAPRELRSLPNAADPLFGGVTAVGDELAWSESVAGRGGRAITRLWTVNWRSAAAPRMLTADTGAVAFFNSQHDMVIAGGRLHWVAVSPGREPATEVRSVALTGSTVTVRNERGPWALSAWPWLVSAVTSATAEVQLRNLEAGTRFTVPAGATELVTCSPVWCRNQVIAGNGPARLDMMRPDGSDRRTIGGAEETAPIVDVGLLDRFELLTRPGRSGTATSSQDLLLYDITRKRKILIDDGVGSVVSRAGLVWWSTGDAERMAWHTLDLRTLD